MKRQKSTEHNNSELENSSSTQKNRGSFMMMPVIWRNVAWILYRKRWQHCPRGPGLKRICSTPASFENRAKELTHFLEARGYHHKFVCDQIQKVRVTIQRRITDSFCGGWKERTSYDDTCHLKKCCVSPVRKEVTAVSKRLGKMDMVVEKLRTFQESCGLMLQSHCCNPHDPRMEGEHRDVWADLPSMGKRRVIWINIGFSFTS